MLDPGQFESCFLNWIRDIAKLKLGEVIAVDGKRLRGTKDTHWGKPAVEMISAWASSVLRPKWCTQLSSC